jgi:hypothetical protein
LGAEAKTVRTFAVANRISMEDVVTYQAFRDKMFALVDAAYPGRSTLVEPGLDDVASHIQPADGSAPDLVLVNFPESVGLPAAFIGTRGAAARTAFNSTVAFLSLYNRYAQPINYYRPAFGMTVGDIVPQVVVGVTDTLYRAFYETFRDIAVTYGVYVTAGLDAAPARVMQQSEDPALFARLIDPDEVGDRTYVYVATSADIVNATYLFQPDGEIFVQNADGTTTSAPSGTGGVLVGSATKVYLTPIELTLLKLLDGPVDRLDVLDTPVGRLGVVISKDAWMTDINERLAARHAHLMIQSEAFSSWAFAETPWDPDIFKQGGYNNLQRHPTLRYNVAPSMTGNLLEITFDGQTAISGHESKSDPGPLSAENAWIGQNPATGFLAMAPWVVEDPGIASPALTLAQRRAELVDSGVALLPGSGVACPPPPSFGPCENGYREAVEWADLELPDGVDVLVDADPTPPVATAYGFSQQVNEDDALAPASQLYPRIVADGEEVYVVWQDTRHGSDAIYGSYSADGGATWSNSIKVSDNLAGSVVEMLPDLSFYRDPRIGVATLYVVWQQLSASGSVGDGRVMLARFDEAFGKLGPDLRVDTADGAGKWNPAVIANPRKRGAPLVVWNDEREMGPELSVLERLYARRSRGARGQDGRPVIEFRRERAVVDPRWKEVDRLSRQLANEWHPDVTVSDTRFHFAWVDFRSYNWDVYAGVSRGGTVVRRGGSRIDDSLEFERLNSHPAIAYAPAGERLVLVWSDQRERNVDADLFISTSVDAGATWTTPSQLDEGDVGRDLDLQNPTNQWHPSVAASGSVSCVAWQDDRLGNSDIFAATSSDAGNTFGSDERVDDSDDGASEQFSPEVAIAQNRCYVVWVDNRSGDFDIRVASKAF